jgi:hypothetical protein
MNHFLYLIAWAAFSESSGDEDTKVNTQEDLLPQFIAGNEHVFAVKILIPIPFCDSDDERAVRYGDAEAFRNNYTAWDSTSICMWVPHDFKYPDGAKIKEVFAV